jgi:hypothetical protein
MHDLAVMRTASIVKIIHYVMECNCFSKKNVPPFPTGRLIHEVMSLYFESVILMVFEKVRPDSRPLMLTRAKYCPLDMFAASNSS